jgi:hypothetical protein
MPRVRTTAQPSKTADAATLGLALLAVALVTALIEQGVGVTGALPDEYDPGTEVASRLASTNPPR